MKDSEEIVNRTRASDLSPRSISTEEHDALKTGFNLNLRDASTNKYLVDLKHAFKSSGFLEDTTSELRQIMVLKHAPCKSTRRSLGHGTRITRHSKVGQEHNHVAGCQRKNDSQPGQYRPHWEGRPPTKIDNHLPPTPHWPNSKTRDQWDPKTLQGMQRITKEESWKMRAVDSNAAQIAKDSRRRHSTPIHRLPSRNFSLQASRGTVKSSETTRKWIKPLNDQSLY